jgi:hypothetical protein
MFVDEFRKRLSHVHERQFRFAGFLWTEELTDAAAAAPFSSVVLSRTIAIDYWLAAVISAIPLALYLLFSRKRLRAARRMDRGLCPDCGYDLRAHAAGQKCPECGAVIGVSRQNP